MRYLDAYILTCNEPYDVAGRPPVNATIVHALTLLHPELPQPDGAMMFRCLTERERRPGELVPISTLTFELDGGRLWGEVADWDAVSTGFSELARKEKCDAMPMTLPSEDLHAVANGPGVQLTVVGNGRTVELPSDYRQGVLTMLEQHIAEMAAGGRFWPGNDLVPIPRYPQVMPYKPFRQL